MKQIITVFSDSHGNLDAINKLRPKFLSSDKIVFLGDGRYDLNLISSDFGNKLYYVDGNCDGYGFSPELIFSVGSYKILAVHGHKFYVKSGLDSIILYAKEQGCNVVLFGHTHLPLITNVRGITLINPGTISCYGARTTYCTIEIDEDKFSANIEEIL